MIKKQNKTRRFILQWKTNTRYLIYKLMNREIHLAAFWKTFPRKELFATLFCLIQGKVRIIGLWTIRTSIETIKHSATIDRYYRYLNKVLIILQTEYPSLSSPGKKWTTEEYRYAAQYYIEKFDFLFQQFYCSNLG